METERQERHQREVAQQLRREQDLAFEETIAQHQQSLRRREEEKNRQEGEKIEQRRIKSQLEWEFGQLTTGSIMPNVNDEHVCFLVFYSL